MNYCISTDNDSRKKWKYQLSWISDEATLSMAAKYRFDSSSHNWKRRHRRSARWIHDNVRKKIARGYQKSHEWCVRRRNVRNSRRALQYLQRLRNNARGISSKILIVITKAFGTRIETTLWISGAWEASKFATMIFYNTRKNFPTSFSFLLISDGNKQRVKSLGRKLDFLTTFIALRGANSFLRGAHSNA